MWRIYPPIPVVPSLPLASPEVYGYVGAWPRSTDITFLPMYRLSTVVRVSIENLRTLSEWVASIGATSFTVPAVVLPTDKYFHLFSSLWSPHRWLEGGLILKATTTLITTLPSWSTTLDFNQATSQHSPVQPLSSRSGYARTKLITLTRESRYGNPLDLPDAYS